MTEIEIGTAVEVFDREQHSVRVESRPVVTNPKKLTAARLEKVEQIQRRMVEIVALLGDLTEEEENGWIPGSPQTGSTRVEPLRKITGEIASGVETLENLYS